MCSVSEHLRTRTHFYHAVAMVSVYNTGGGAVATTELLVCTFAVSKRLPLTHAVQQLVDSSVCRGLTIA
jgi:hypothetical protein